MTGKQISNRLLRTNFNCFIVRLEEQTLQPTPAHLIRPCFYDLTLLFIKSLYAHKRFFISAQKLNCDYKKAQRMFSIFFLFFHEGKKKKTVDRYVRCVTLLLACYESTHELKRFLEYFSWKSEERVLKLVHLKESIFVCWCSPTIARNRSVFNELQKICKNCGCWLH